MVSSAYYKMLISIPSFPSNNPLYLFAFSTFSIKPVKPSVTILNKRGASGSPSPQYYHSLAQCTTELSWIQTLLNELQVPFNTPIVLYDNQNVVALAHKPILHARTKHMDIDVFFVQENVLTKYMIVHHVPPGY